MSQLLPQFREIPSWREDNIFPTIPLKTAISIEKELWIMLRSYSEVRQRGVELLKSHGIQPSGISKTWNRFRSYVKQAEYYWNAATATSYESSSLLYYYSFLNLIKAFLVLRDPTLPHDIHHGLSFQTSDNSSSLRNKFVNIQLGSKEAFSLYYKKVFLKDPPSQLKITSLLAYPIDVSFQYASGGFGSRKSIPFIYRIAIDPNRKKTWLICAIPSLARLKYFKSIFNNFFDEFEQTSRPNRVDSGFRELFNFQAQDWASYDFYQSKISKEIDFIGDKVPTGIVVQKIRNCFEPWLSPNFYADEFSGYINLPKDKKNNNLINEEIAIYAVMFFMSEIVRYRPDYLDKILSSKASWLLESFVETCPLKFLRAIVCRILGKVVVISNF